MATPMIAAVRRNKFDRRAVLKALFGAPLSSLPAMTVMRSAHAQAALQPIRMGIQIFTGAVATVWFEKKIYEKRGLLVEARQFADGRSVRDAMVADQLNAGTMNITPFIVGAAVSSLTMVGVVSLGGDTVGVLALRAGASAFRSVRRPATSLSIRSRHKPGSSRVTIKSSTCGRPTRSQPYRPARSTRLHRSSHI